MCSALNNSGKVDMIWTRDVLDAFLFEAQSVMRASVDSGTFKKPVLSYQKPHESAMAVLTRMNMAQYFGCEV